MQRDLAVSSVLGLPQRFHTTDRETRSILRGMFASTDARSVYVDDGEWGITRHVFMECFASRTQGVLTLPAAVDVSSAEALDGMEREELQRKRHRASLIIQCAVRGRLVGPATSASEEGGRASGDEDSSSTPRNVANIPSPTSSSFASLSTRTPSSPLSPLKRLTPQEGRGQQNTGRSTRDSDGVGQKVRRKSSSSTRIASTTKRTSLSSRTRTRKGSSKALKEAATESAFALEPIARAKLGAIFTLLSGGTEGNALATLSLRQFMGKA